ncbi:MAG: hypothetical protein GY940_01205 [bacterium]|nr:hypothetical protein [bacterium]
MSDTDMDNMDRDKKITELSGRVNALETENRELKKEVESLNHYIEQLEDFLKDEAEVYADAADEDEVTQIRTFSRGKETAFQYVLDNLAKTKPKKTPPEPDPDEKES